MIAGLCARLSEDYLRRWTDHLRRLVQFQVGDEYDRGEPAGVLIDAALQICAVLLARGSSAEFYDTAYLPRDHSLCRHSGGGSCDPVVVPWLCDDRS